MEPSSVSDSRKIGERRPLRSERLLRCVDEDVNRKISARATDSPSSLRQLGVHHMAATPTQGDSAALAAMYRSALPRVYGLLLDRCGSPDLAEELTAQTFEAAASKARRGELSDVTIPWLFVVAKRRLVDHWRALSARERLQDRLMSLPTKELPTSPRSENPEISAALDGLPSRQRLVLTLRYIDEMSVSEIAEGIGMTYRATESLLARARRSFRAGLDQGEVR